MAVPVCPSCGEDEDLSVASAGEARELACGACGVVFAWPPAKACPTCGGTDLRTVPMAILEKSRGTQLSMVGTRPVDLCERCDADDIETWNRNRPNPLYPKDIPTV